MLFPLSWRNHGFQKIQNAVSNLISTLDAFIVMNTIIASKNQVGESPGYAYQVEKQNNVIHWSNLPTHLHRWDIFNLDVHTEHLETHILFSHNSLHHSYIKCTMPDPAYAHPSIATTISFCKPVALAYYLTSCLAPEVYSFWRLTQSLVHLNKYTIRMFSVMKCHTISVSYSMWQLFSVMWSLNQVELVV
jgi:hypothetical protein